MSTATPVFGEPLLLVEGKERVLVASDLHLGLEHELWLGGISIPSQTEKILDRLTRSLIEAMPDRLILLGDVKHNVPRTSWQERKEIPSFLRALAERVKVDIVPGNHDGGLADLAPDGTRVHLPSGIIIDGVGYFHGHTWPDRELLKAKLLIAGHIHPAVRLKDSIRSLPSRKVWVRSSISLAALEQQYGRFEYMSAQEMVIMPAFNDLCGGLPLNEPIEDERGPIIAMANLKDAGIFLLDGLNLGRLRDILSAQTG